METKRKKAAAIGAGTLYLAMGTVMLLVGQVRGSFALFAGIAMVASGVVLVTLAMRSKIQPGD